MNQDYNFSPSEKRTVEQIEKDISVFKKLIHNEEVRFNKIQTQHELKVKKLEGESFHLSMKISRIVDKLRARCKHNGGKTKHRNYRDDASFEFWLSCDLCGEHVGSEGERYRSF